MTRPLARPSGAWQVTRRHLRVWRKTAAASAVGYIGEPLLYLAALGVGLGRLVPGVEGLSYGEFMAPGLVISTAMYTATFECTFGSYTRMETQGTFDAILATPITLGELVAGEVLFGAIKACVAATVVLVVAAGFGLVPSWAALGAVPLAFLAGLVFSAMALTVTGLSGSYEVFNYYFTLVVAPMYLFGGVFFPLGELPAWAQRATLLSPLTHAVLLSRRLVRGAVDPTDLLHTGPLLLVLLPALWFGQHTLRRRLVR